MTQPSSPDAGRRRDLGAELIIPVVALAFTLYYFHSIAEAPWTAKVSTYLIGGILILLVAIFAVKCAIGAIRDGARFGFGVLLAPGSLLPQRLALLVITVGYVYALEFGGFTLTTFVFLYLAMLLLGGRAVLRTALLLATAYAIGGYLLFILAFDTRFPRGPFETLVERVIG
jgi:hypothetical protein